MKFISPNGIASQIKDLIDEAEKTLIIVSPYVNISSWGRMKKCLERAVKSGVNITFVMRRNQTPAPNIEPLTSLGIKPVLVDDLHAKVYINDKYGIVTSQNMISYSEINSIDIAYKTDNIRERNELVDFVKKHVHNFEEVSPTPKPSVKVNTKTTENTIVFNEYQVERFTHSFKRVFRRADFTPTSTYLFCSALLPFADVMISARYIIKFKKARPDCNQIIEYFQNFNYLGYHHLKMELQTTHKTFYYLEFVPTKPIELQKLIDDYQYITKRIVDSKVGTPVERVQGTVRYR